MTLKTKQEQAPARAEQPAPAGKSEQPKGAAFSEAAVTELTDTDLQAVTGGGAASGIGGDISR